MLKVSKLLLGVNRCLKVFKVLLGVVGLSFSSIIIFVDFLNIGYNVVLLQLRLNIV